MAFLAPLGALFGGGGAAAAGAGAGAAAAGAGGFSLGSVFTVGSALLGAVGSVASGAAQAKAAKFNAAAQEANAKVELDQAAARATEAARRTRQRVAATRAAALENGFEDTGSIADLIDTVGKQGTLEALTAIYDGTNRAQGMFTSAKLDRMNAKSAKIAGFINAGNSVLSGFSDAYTG